MICCKAASWEKLSSMFWYGYCVWYSWDIRNTRFMDHFESVNLEECWEDPGICEDYHLYNGSLSILVMESWNDHISEYLVYIINCHWFKTHSSVTKTGSYPYSALKSSLEKNNVVSYSPVSDLPFLGKMIKSGGRTTHGTPIL